jgi:SAM-dependent methyltransferase
MKEFWNERYSGDEFAYGVHPNEFLKEQIDDLDVGNALFPAEGEGRNAVYAAKLGWNVHAFDFSEKGRSKALNLARKASVELVYEISDYNSYDPKGCKFNFIGLFYTHADPSVRHSFNQKISNCLQPGGILVLEAFSKNQLGKTSGGPKNSELLYSIDEIKDDFASLEIVLLKEEEVELHEGVYHEGSASVVRLVARY